MPSAFAHGFVAASLATTLPASIRPRWFVAALAGLAAAPDLDVIAYSLGVPYAHPLGHRGVTHSLFFAASIGALSFPLWRRALPSHRGLAAALTGLALASHGVLDTFTDAGLGIGLFLPFEGSRYFAPWRPILTSPLSVDAFFSGRGLAILQNEALWVGLPCLVFAAGVAAIRLFRSARPTPRS